MEAWRRGREWAEGGRGMGMGRVTEAVGELEKALIKD